MPDDWPSVEVEVGDLSADHPADDLGGLGLVARGGGDELAVAEDGHGVGEGEDLVHLVGDVEDGRPGGLEVVDHPEEAGDLGVGEGGGGLVHDHDRGVEGEGLGDLDHLLVADPEVGDPRPRARSACPAVRRVSRAASSIARASSKPKAPVFSRPRKRLAATESSGTRFNSW